MNPHAVYLEVGANNSNNDDDNEVFQNLLSMKKVSFNKLTLLSKNYFGNLIKFFPSNDGCDDRT